MRKVLLVQPTINPPGGGNGVAAWMIEALRPDHEVTLLADAAPDLARVNHAFGTTLEPKDLRVELAPARLPGLARLSPLPLALLRGHALLAAARAAAPRFDAVLTANNEGDLGRRGLQYIHFPKFQFPRPDVDLRWVHRSPALVRAYYRLAARVSGFSLERMRANLTLVNSAWTGRLVRALHGIDPAVLHPPVAGPFPVVPWESRAEGFICVGRIAPEKRIELVADIVRRLRRTRPQLTLLVAGSADDGATLARVERLAAESGGWMTVETDLPRAALLERMAARRYGIHGMAQEHFGMALAELARAGCLPFAPADGGQVEVLGDERLLYGDLEDAVRKIEAVIEDPAVERDARRRLGERALAFSTERFVRELRVHVASILCG